MTKTEIERLAVVEEKVDALKESLDGLRADMCAFIDKADTRYASKSVEKVVYWIMAAVGVAIIGAAMELILK